MEYVLNTANSVSQSAFGPARGIEDALARALHTVVPSAWPAAPAAGDPTLYIAIGIAALVVGYFVFRR